MDSIASYWQAFDLEISDKLLMYEAEYAVLEDEGATSFALQNSDANEDLELKYSRLLHAHHVTTKQNLELVEQLEVSLQ